MRRLLIVGVAILGLVAITASGASASGTGDAGGNIRVLEIRTSVQQVDVGASGLSPGDEFILGGRLRNLANTETVGHASDVCTVLAVTASGAPLHCVSVVWLAGGTLELAGAASGGPSFRLAITGGTRSYDTAKGQVSASQGQGGEILTFDID